MRIVEAGLLYTAGFLCVALIGATAKAVSSEISAVTILFFQFFVCWLLVLPLVFRHGLRGLKTRVPLLHFVRGIGGLTSFLTLFFAVRWIPLVDAVLLQNSAPLWIPFVLYFWKGVKVKGHLWWGIGLGLVGICLILKPGAEILDWGAVIGVVSGMTLAVGLIGGKLLLKTESIRRIMFYYLLLGWILALPFAIALWFPPTLLDWALLVAVGIFMYGAQLLVTQGLRMGKASTLGPLSYMAVPFSGVLGWFFWDQVPDWIALIGIILVVSGGIIAIVLERRDIRRGV